MAANKINKGINSLTDFIDPNSMMADTNLFKHAAIRDPFKTAAKKSVAEGGSRRNAVTKGGSVSISPPPREELEGSNRM